MYVEQIGSPILCSLLQWSNALRVYVFKYNYKEELTLGTSVLLSFFSDWTNISCIKHNTYQIKI